jgi:hypothetical protein
MTSGLAAGASFVVGVVLAVLGTIGGVNAVTPGANPASASDQVVTYDAP